MNKSLLLLLVHKLQSISKRNLFLETLTASLFGVILVFSLAYAVNLLTICRVYITLSPPFGSPISCFGCRNVIVTLTV